MRIPQISNNHMMDVLSKLAFTKESSLADERRSPNFHYSLINYIEGTLAK